MENPGLIELICKSKFYCSGDYLGNGSTGSYMVWGVRLIF